MRLDKCLASGGEWSRSQIKIMCKAGRITVNGNSVVRPETHINPETDVIYIDGVPFSYSENYYVMVYKPQGVITATEDKREKTVLSLLPDRFQKLKLFPAGRLDKDAEGFVIMTTDGALAHALMSPKHKVDKIYYVHVDGKLDETDIAEFEKGVVIDGDILCAPAVLEIVESAETSRAFVTLREGRFHQLKRMFIARGKTVTFLKRISIGGVKLDESLEPSAFRQLTKEEVLVLQKASGVVGK